MEVGLGEADVVVGVHKPSTILKTSCATATSKKPSARALDAALADGSHANTYTDPYAPYTSPGLKGNEYPWGGRGGKGSYNGHGSTAALPLVTNASPF
ncbi:hypothetical protein C8F04DRAFT_1272182 [Mycena alexandri]|uniref:Uncharacterized protein n=1 Tax=Mycena alexandri TaxID=1745969 RepID=A0AAD6S7W5_9AGAR|nr:hypothetical protein C8F04DRAFT_1272182 [Mycena alexandri]